MTAPRPHFDFIARPYRWLEYLTFGRILERCRLHFLPALRGRSRALVLGDGDGRFLARLFQQNSTLSVDAVDISPVMLQLLERRCERVAPYTTPRLSTHHTDALTFLSTSPRACYDVVVTHFFLDCLTQSQLSLLAAHVASHLVPGALWLVSDFRIPAGIMRFPATLLVRMLYLAFRTLTGLQTIQLPDHNAALSAVNFTLSARHLSLFGILTTEIWIFDSISCLGSHGMPPGEFTSSIM